MPDGFIFNGGNRDLWGREWPWPKIRRDMSKPDTHSPATVPLDSNRIPPHYLGPTASRPEVITDVHRILLVDPTDGSYVGFDAPRGASGELGRMVYAGRTPASRAF